MASAPAAVDPNQEIYDAIRKADAAGDGEAVAKLSGYLSQAQSDPSSERGQFGSGGVEDQGNLGEGHQNDAPDDATDIQRDEAGNLIGYRDGKTHRWTVAISGNATPAQVAGVSDGTLAAGARGVGDTATFGGLNRIAAGVHAVGDALHGGDFSDSYDQNLKQLQDVMHADEANHPVARGVGQLLGGLTIPPGLGLESVGLNAGKSALRAGHSIQEARAIAAVAVRNRMTALGAGAGATHGALTSDNLLSTDALENAAIEGAAGAASGLALGKIEEAVAPRLAARAAATRALPLSDAERAAQTAAGKVSDVADAAAQENIPISRPYVDPTVRNKVTALETTKGGNQPVRGGLNSASDAIEGGVQNLGGSGTAVNSEVGGQKLQAAGLTFIRDSGKRSNRLYTRAQTLSQGVKVIPRKALDTIDAHLADLNEAPETNKAVISYLTGLRSDLARRDGLSIQTLRDIRTGVRGNLNQANLTQTNAERLAGDALSAASDDISDALGPEARAAYKAADANYAERMGTIKNVVKQFIGPRDANISPEKAFAKFQAMATPKGDNARMAAMLKLLPPEDRADIAATFAGDLGRNGKGEFSPAILATQAEKLPLAAAKNLFGDEGAASLKRLSTVAKEHAAIVGNLNNSRTAVATNYRGLLPSILGVAAGGTAGFLTHGIEGGAVAAYVGQKAANAANDFSDKLSARALMNTDLTKWLAKAPATTRGQAAVAYTNLLGGVAARNPAIAHEVLGLRGRILEVLANGGSQKLAASPPGPGDSKQDRRPIVPQPESQ